MVSREEVLDRINELIRERDSIKGDSEEKSRKMSQIAILQWVVFSK